MRPSSPEALSSSSSRPPPRRLKHRRRLSPSPSQPESESESSSPRLTADESVPDRSSASLDYPYTDSVPETFSYDATNVLSTYVNVAPLPVFRGDPGECPVAHLSRFVRVCRANNASTPAAIARVFPVTLDGGAALWYELEIEPDPSAAESWDAVRSAFLASFRRPDLADSARAELMALRQGESEPVAAYHLRLRWILRRWPDHGLPDSLLKGLFVDGLRDEFQDWVAPRRPESLADAVRLARAWEEAGRARANRRLVSAAHCGFCGGPHEEAGCEVRSRMRELWMKKSGDERKEEAAAAVERVGSSLGRRSQCQCWKHQCWKRFERSNSVVSNCGDENKIVNGGTANTSTDQ